MSFELGGGAGWGMKPMSERGAPRAQHVLDAVLCQGCEQGWPRKCSCGGLVHGSRTEGGRIATACDRCLATAEALRVRPAAAAAGAYGR
jgi:hypothetical protein